eukprot:1147780-Pelagomonas_calceolata.AAC.5
MHLSQYKLVHLNHTTAAHSKNIKVAAHFTHFHSFLELPVCDIAISIGVHHLKSLPAIECPVLAALSKSVQQCEY